jgi:p-cumate 2,3-dioxygenase ferredoxin subunit
MMQMTKTLALFPVAELEAGDMRQAILPDGRAIALYNVEGRIYATDDHCTHGEVSLTEEGSLSGKIVECSWHFGTFDVTTGAALGMPCEVPLKTYPVHIEDGVIHVEI